MTGIIVDMYDSEAATAANIPGNAPKVAGYDTGTMDVQWNNSLWAHFPHAGHVHIDQSPNLESYASGASSVADIEPGAGTVQAFIAATKNRIANGHMGWAGVSQGDVALVAGHLLAAEIDLSHVGLWMFDWNLNRKQAVALIGTKYAGLEIVAVQWASPRSNPNTILPGSNLTLAQANVDMSVALESWFPPAEPPVPVPEHVSGVVVTSALETLPVTSVDGHTWTVT